MRHPWTDIRNRCAYHIHVTFLLSHQTPYRVEIRCIDVLTYIFLKLSTYCKDRFIFLEFISNHEHLHDAVFVCEGFSARPRLRISQHIRKDLVSLSHYSNKCKDGCCVCVWRWWREGGLEQPKEYLGWTSSFCSARPRCDSSVMCYIHQNGSFMRGFAPCILYVKVGGCIWWRRKVFLVGYSLCTEAQGS